MSDLGLVRYLGYVGCASLPAVRARLEAEQAACPANGIHLIAMQSAAGSLVVGESHRYAVAPGPFQPRDVDDRMLPSSRRVSSRRAAECAAQAI